LGVDGCRRLWKIERKPDKRAGVSDNVILLSDGGKSPWTTTTCHLEETCLKEIFNKNQEKTIFSESEILVTPSRKIQKKKSLTQRKQVNSLQKLV